MNAGAEQLEILEVEVAPDDPALRGSHLGVPEPGERIDPRALILRGWVLAEGAPAAAVEVIHQGAIVARSPVELPRPDIGAAHPDLPHAASCGFEFDLKLAAADGEVRLELWAVLDPLRRAPIATLSMRLQPPAEAESVSIVIPCFRQAHFLPEAIESALCQSHPRLELLVIDDGSPDNAGEVAARYPGVQCLQQPNGGLAAARNAGLAAAAGDFVLFLDADDRLLPEAVERGIEELRAEPTAMMAAGTWRLIGEGGEPVPADPPRQPDDVYAALLESCFISTPAAVLYRRELFARVGDFDPGVSASADYDLYLRAADRFPLRLHDHVVAEYRRHGANMTRDSELILRSEVAVLERRRPLVEGRPDLEEALERGLTRSRAYHGERLERMRADGATAGASKARSIAKGRLVELVAVDVETLDADSPLRGASVDSPTAGRTMAASALEIGGWALGRAGRPDAVEVAAGDAVLAAGAWRQRPDLAVGFADIDDATSSGFEVIVDAGVGPAEVELEVRARLGGRVAPFAHIRLRRHWRVELDRATAPLISIVVLGERAGERGTQSTLQSISVQRHPLTEVLVLRSTGSRLNPPSTREESRVRDIAGGRSDPVLRNEGIRRSNGELILFVEAGSALAPDAIRLGIQMLAGKPDAVAVVDGNEAWVAAGLYRRAGFEALEGFADAGDEDCDLELAGRAKRYGALFAPGALVVGGS